MTNLSNALKHLFPGIDFLTDVVLQDNGNGPYIAKWNLADPQPTEQALIDAELDGLKSIAYTAVKAEAGRRIVEGLNLPNWKQQNITAQSIFITEKLASGQALTQQEEDFRVYAKSLWSSVAAIRSASNEIEADIGALTTVVDVETAIAGIPTNPKWP